MELDVYPIVFHERRLGEQTVTLAAPSNIKVQTTGPGASELLNVGPAPGETWDVIVRVEIRIR